MIDSAGPLPPPLSSPPDAAAQAVLDQLHPLLLPLLPAWAPQTAGWAVLAVIVLMALLWAAWRGGQRWRAGRFRRLALAELTRLRGDLQSAQFAERPAAQLAAARQLPALVRRLALAHAPRHEVASLQGAAWGAWLDRSLDHNLVHSPGRSPSEPTQAFTQGAGQRLSEWAYLPPEQLPWDTLPALLVLLERWIRQHRVAETAHVQELQS